MLLTAGVSSQPHLPVPASLVHSTIRIALGSTSANTAAVLARGVLNTMLINQLKVAGALAFIASICLAAGLAWAVGLKPMAQPLNAKPPGATAGVVATADGSKPIPRQVEVRGVVVDEAGQPVAGAQVRAERSLLAR